jgi:hypothetical protein
MELCLARNWSTLESPYISVTLYFRGTIINLQIFMYIHKDILVYMYMCMYINIYMSTLESPYI